TKAKYDAKLLIDPGIRHPDGAANTTFAGMTEDLDTTVGQLMQYLDGTPDPRNPGHVLADNTYVFYLADNGATEASGNNLPLYDEKASTWEGGIRVPMLVRGPGVAANSVSPVPVVSTDLYATLSSLAGASSPLPPASESADLSEILHNGGALPAGVDSLQRGLGGDGELFFHFPHYQHDKGTTPMSAMVDGSGRFKLVRIYGAGGEPTRDYLFDLTTPIVDPLQTWEDAQYSDPRNLAEDPAFAGQLASMQSRFDRWIQEVDASLPYESAAPVRIEWDASDNHRARGLEGPDWRAVSDVDERSREQWLIDETVGSVELTDLVLGDQTGVPRGLGDKAYRVDAGGGFRRTFFHVSELNPGSTRLTAADNDDSATFEFWVRADALDRGQVLLETGGGDKGLSITLGDADDDGVFDDVRLRAASASTNQAIVATASLADVSITSEFVHLTAVIKDDAAGDRQWARIYVNGTAVAESDVVLGGGTVDWDGTNDAGLAVVEGALGASGGPGDGPLGTAGFSGEIARVAFFNYALSSAEIAQRSGLVFAFVDGDLNGDLTLDAEDVVRFRQHWLASTDGLDALQGYRSGDLNEDGRV
ncbi:MAG: sulfatase-like hydrolase/transferase, partial [Planctomycetales bacterium]|nr:sulfatase-like hydrolase/transferase [Planctomycetales bacterium]